MNWIDSIEPQKDYTLIIHFKNGTTKIYDCRSILDKEVFKVLQDISIFLQVKNKGYYIEWEKYEIDLSADTLWHDAVEAKEHNNKIVK